MNPDGRLLDVQHLTVDYQGRDRRRIRAVDDVSLTVDRGEIVALVGESGSGKSTIAHAILGGLPDNATIGSGRISLDDLELTTLSERRYDRVRGNDLGFIPQDPMIGLNPLHRVGRQTTETLRIHRRVGRRAAADLAVGLLDKVGIPDAPARARQYPHELSGGMRQRVLIAAALAGDPKLLIADEPTTALDVTVQKAILDDLAELVRARGIAVLIITHDLAVAADRADRIIVLRDGRIVEEGRPSTVLHDPRHAYTRALLASAPSLATVLPRAPRPAVESASTLVEVDGAVKEFRLPGKHSAGARFRAVDEVSLTVRAGETLGLVGESGSGKSTLARLILGLVPATAGRVLFDGADVGGLHRADLRALRRRAQLIYQNPYASLNPLLSVRQIVGEPLDGFRIGDRESRRQRVRDLLDQVGLDSSFDERRPAELSGGQRQRVAIARALAAGPELLVCDEPVSALDVSIQAQILELLNDLQRRLGLALLFISHDLAVIRTVADRVGVMKTGRLVELGSADDVFERPAHDYTRHLLAAIPGSRLARAGSAGSL